MSLKAFEFEMTVETGHRLSIYLIFRTLVIDNDLRTATLLFQGYPTQTERERQAVKGAGNFIQFRLDLAALDYLSLFLTPVGGPLGLAVSDLVWSLAQTTPFIADFSIDDDGNLSSIKKSLADLDAKEIIVPIEISDEMAKALAERK